MYSEQDSMSINIRLSHNLVLLVLEIFLKNKSLVIISLTWLDLFCTGHYRIAGKFGKLTLFEHLAKESLAN